MLPKAVLALLRKLSKGLKGTFDADAVEATFKLFGPAWTVSEVVAPLAVTSSEATTALLKPWLSKHDARAWGYDGVKEPKEFWFKDTATATQALAEFKTLVRGSGPKGPSSVTLGDIYVSKIGDVRFERERYLFDVTGIWVGVRALTFKMPKGDMTLPFKPGMDATELSSDRFWKLAYASGARELALETLGSYDRVEVEKVLAPSKIRDLDNTGTCPVCFNNIKLSARSAVPGMPGMVLHGYKRPGHGSVEGNCFGQGWPPFELSPKGTIAYANRLSIHVAMLRDQLSNLSDATQLPDPHSIRAKPITKEESEPRVWALAMERAEEGLKYKINWTEMDITRLEKAASTWKAMPLPTGLKVAMRYLLSR
jgi:hypothetical protein